MKKSLMFTLPLLAVLKAHIGYVSQLTSSSNLPVTKTNDSALGSSTWSASFSNLFYNFKADPKIEKSKFPDLQIDLVLRAINPDKGWGSIKNKYFEFECGSLHDPKKYYKGAIIFVDLTYGALEVNLDEEKIEALPQIKLINQRDEIDAYKFIAKYKSDFGTAVRFIKGDPRRTEQGNTEIDYFCYGNPIKDRGIKVTVIRHSHEKFLANKANLYPVRNALKSSLDDK